MINETRLAETLGVHVDMVVLWRLQQTGPPAVKVAGQWRYFPDEVEAWRQLTFGGPETASSPPSSDTVHVKLASPKAVSRAA